MALFTFARPCYIFYFPVKLCLVFILLAGATCLHTLKYIPKDSKCQVWNPAYYHYTNIPEIRTTASKRRGPNCCSPPRIQTSTTKFRAWRAVSYTNRDQKVAYRLEPTYNASRSPPWFRSRSNSLTVSRAASTLAEITSPSTTRTARQSDVYGSWRTGHRTWRSPSGSGTHRTHG